jgi:hypothetical protein
VNPLARRFPEIYRCLLTECPQGRLALGAGASLALGACFWTSATWSQDPGRVLFQYAFWTQVAALVIYGSIRASASIADEREAKTWDLQRLTPLTSGDVAGGKLLGAPLYGAFLAAMMLPFALAGALRSATLVNELPFIYLQFFATAFLALSLALLTSAYSDLSRGGSATTSGAMIGLGCLYTMAPAMSKSGSGTFVYCGIDMPYELWMPFATAGFGAWAFAAAKWRVGRDLLEPSRFWRFPAFALYLIVFVLGFEKASAYFALILPVGATLTVALAEPTTPESWRRWLASKEPRELLDRMPAWISGAAVCLAAAVLLSFKPPTPGLEFYRRVPLLLALFLIRDAAFIQCCRFTKSRRPQILALVFLALAYIIPAIVLTASKSASLMYMVMPVASKDVPAWLNLLPGLVWAVLALAALVVVSTGSTLKRR